MTQDNNPLEMIREKIGIAIGEASMCWNETPNGVFDSSRASIIVEELLADVILYGIGKSTSAIGEAEAEREKVRKLVEALKFECGDRCSDINPCNAKEVLKEIEKT